MALTPSNMLPLATVAPDFNLPDTLNNDQVLSLSAVLPNKGLLVMFICNHCPYVKHINDELVRLGTDYQNKGISMIAISSNNAASHPEDGPELMKRYGMELGYTFPYLYDETQQVAKAYEAACTPDFFLFDKSKKLVYRGQLDDSRPGNGKPVTGRDLRAAMDTLMRGEEITGIQIPSVGCNIKWK